MHAIRPLAAYVLVFCAISARGDNGVPGFRLHDPRLEQVVSLSQTSISVADLCTRLEQETKVALSVGQNDGAGGVLVSVHVKHVPLADIMEALWSLMSYRGAEWSWRKTETNAQPTYKFVRPLAAQMLAGRLQQIGQDLFEEEARAFVAAARLEGKQREEAVLQVVTKLLQQEPSLAQEFLRSDRMWRGLLLFGSLCSEAERAAVLRGARSVRISGDGLGAEGRAFTHSIWRSDASRATQITFPERRAEPVPEPSWMEFYVRRSGGGLGITPSLFIQLEGLGAYAYLGGVPLEKAMRHRILELWQLAGDGGSTAFFDRTISPPALGAIPQSTDRRLERDLETVSRGAEVSLIARLPSDSRGYVTDPTGRTVGKYLEDTASRPPFLQSKVRRGILLVTYPGWIWDTDTGVPAPFVSRLREARKQTGGVLPLRALAEVAASLSARQVATLSAEFPELTRVEPVRSLLAECHGQPLMLKAIASDAGAAVDGRLAELLNTNRLAAATLSKHACDRVRLRTLRADDRHELLLDIRDETKHWLPILRIPLD
jgi:hypothetical protein